MNEPSSGDARLGERSLSWLIRILCMALAPILVLATPNVAQAATTYGPGTTIEFEWDSGFYGSWGRCKVPAFWSWDGTTQHVVIQGARCNLGFSVDNDHGFGAVFKGADLDGAACSSAVIIGTTDVASNYWGASSTTTLPYCQINSVCYELYGDGGETRFEECTGSLVGGPQRPAEQDPECLQGTAKRPVVGPRINGGPDYYTARQLSFTIEPKPHGTATGTWQTYAVLRKIAGSPPIGSGSRITLLQAYSGGGQVAANTDRWSGYGALTADSGTALMTVHTSERYSNAQGPPALEQWEVVGAGMYRIPPAVGSPTANPNSNSSALAAWRIGRNDPGVCSFYWGIQVYDVTSTTTDDTPAGPLVAPPPVSGGTDTPPPAGDDPSADPVGDNGGCEGFSFFNPTTWASAGICAIVGALKSVWEAVKAVADAIGSLAETIVSAIGGLFIPDPGFFDAKFASLEDSFDDTAPGQYVESVETLTPSGGASGGCSGPSVPIDVMGIDKTIEPLNACSGAAANAAALVKLLLTVGLAVFGAIACVRGIGSGLGWNVDLGKGADA